MFEARLTSSAVLKKVLDAIKDLLNEATFDCSDSGIQVKLIKILKFVKLLAIFFAIQLWNGSTTNLLVRFSFKPWTIHTFRWCRWHFVRMDSINSVAIAICRWAWIWPAWQRSWNAPTTKTHSPWRPKTMRTRSHSCSNHQIKKRYSRICTVNIHKHCNCYERMSLALFFSTDFRLRNEIDELGPRAFGHSGNELRVHCSYAIDGICAHLPRFVTIRWIHGDCMHQRR